MAHAEKALSAGTVGGPPRVLLFDAAYDDLAGVVRRILGEFPLSWSGARVLVKPNMLGPYPPERGVTTHPALVAAVVDALLEAGARPMVGDNPGARGYGVIRRCAEVTGIRGASRGCFVNLGERLVEVPVDSPVTRTLRVSREVVEADLVVNLPKLKTHVQTVLTAGVKNTYGYLVGAEKSRLHSLARTAAGFARVLTDVYAVRPPHLTIIDAVTVMEGDGPAGGSLRRMGKLVAAADAVAADLAVCRLIGLDPERLLHLKEARRRWPASGAFVAGGPVELTPVPDFRFPRSFARDFKSYLANLVLFTFLRRQRLVVRRDRCTACGQCAQGCPAEAIDLSGGFPLIDRRKCVACYCCHELCQFGAIELNPALRAILDRDCDPGPSGGGSEPCSGN